MPTPALRGRAAVQMLMGPHQMAEIGHVSIQVRRDHVLEDSIQQLQLHMAELRKPLRITFLGGEHGAIKEEAVDEGTRAPPPLTLPLLSHPYHLSPPCVPPCAWVAGVRHL